MSVSAHAEEEEESLAFSSSVCFDSWGLVVRSYSFLKFLNSKHLN
jgi:hypothetical protein